MEYVLIFAKQAKAKAKVRVKVPAPAAVVVVTSKYPTGWKVIFDC